MMSLTFGLFTQVSGSGPLGPLVKNWTGKTKFYGPIFLLPVGDKIGFKTQKSVQNRKNRRFL